MKTGFPIDSRPIQVDGISEEGRFAFFDLSGSFEFDISNPTGVAEPATLAHLALGLAGLGFSRRKRA